ncbi:hypothetical protein [Streptomyces sp. NPDC013187]|uniref:hypothetical protein n=1 Tax=Streptomyces sp. NPDC013187 TaxID=3364865 RepID=UPI0036910EE9
MTAAVAITDDQALATLREVVAERPEYVYSAPAYMQEIQDGEDPSCFYVHKDEDGSIVAAGCAVGVVLNRLGLPLEELVKHEGKTAYQLVNTAPVEVTTKTRDLLNRMQTHQDSGDPWGLAYAKTTGETI